MTGGVAGKLTYRIHGIITANIEEISDIHSPEFFKKSRIKGRRQIVREFIAAGA